MPSFGSLLKKKRTKDKDGEKASGSTLSTVTSAHSTHSANKEFNNPLQPTQSNLSAVSSHTSAQVKDDSMQSPMTHPQQGTASIQNILNQPGQQQQQQQSAPSQMLLDKPPQQNGGGQQQPGLKQMADGNWPVRRDATATKGKYTLTDFNIQRTLGTGSFGRVHLVQSKHNQRFYAVKVLKKAQVVKMKQVEHTNDERRMLAEVKHPFLITLWGTFHDSKNLYMVMDFVEGGELFSLLRKSQVS